MLFLGPAGIIPEQCFSKHFLWVKTFLAHHELLQFLPPPSISTAIASGNWQILSLLASEILRTTPSPCTLALYSSAFCKGAFHPSATCLIRFPISLLGGVLCVAVISFAETTTSPNLTFLLFKPLQAPTEKIALGLSSKMASFETDKEPPGTSGPLEHLINAIFIFFPWSPPMHPKYTGPVLMW